MPKGGETNDLTNDLVNDLTNMGASQKIERTMIGGFTLLSAAGLICKVVGMVFRVSLSGAIGSQGIGLYQAVYPTYNLLLTLSSAGIPVAISRMVAESMTRGDETYARRILFSALRLLAAIGLPLSLLMAFGSGFLANRIGASDARIGFLMISPSILIVSLMSAYRGYIQGHRNMTPTGVSQLIEQLGKVALSLPLSAIGLRTSVVHAAAYALLGITISEGLALIYMLIMSRVITRRHTPKEQDNSAKHGQAEPRGESLYKTLLRVAIPITLGAAIVPLVGTIDSAMILNRLQSAGFTDTMARSLYGLQSGSVLSLLNVPTALAIAVAMSLVPAISGARERGDIAEVRAQTLVSVRLSIIIGLPCAMGMALLALPIVTLLYPSYPASELAIAGRLLSIGAFTIPLFILVQATSGALQGMAAQKIPMYTLLIGAAVKTCLNYALIGDKSINIYGAPISSIVCYALSAAINLTYTIKKTGVKLPIMSVVVKPILATIAMSTVVLLAIRFIGVDSRVKTLLCVVLGVGSFVVAAPLVGAVTRDDVAQFMGRRGRG